MNFIDSLKEYLNDVITESQNNANEEPELEVRFGTYINGRFHPEFEKAILSNLIKETDSEKTCTFIIDTIYSSFDGLKDNVNKIILPNMNKSIFFISLKNLRQEILNLVAVLGFIINEDTEMLLSEKKTFGIAERMES